MLTLQGVQSPIQGRRADLTAGMVVFLVALPLCLGIALASGAPLFSGVIAGIVGGLVVGALSGSSVSVSGPAAGLAVIVAAAIPEAGGFSAFLAAVVIAGALQLLMGVLRLGVIGEYVPNSVIKGMLAGIGIVIVLKQIPHALGRDKDFEGDLSFLEGQENTLTDIVTALLSATGGAVIISAVCLAILLLWERPELKRIRPLAAIPGPLMVVALGIGMNELFRWLIPSWALVDAEHMVRLPVADSVRTFFGQFIFPDAQAFARRQVWIAGATIAVVGSIETLLSLEAADKLDPYKRLSPPNRELFAQGIGNIISGLLGGLPVTSVVVRTSANVYAGAQTKLATIVHGALLLLAALAVPGLLNRTPLACLAAILIIIGYRLARVRLFASMWRAGIDQFLPFIVTVLAIIFADLLKGVMIGMIVGFVFVFRAYHRQSVVMVSQDNHFLIRLNKDMTFMNKSSIKSALRSLPDNAVVFLDGTKALYVDRDIVEVIEEFRKSCRFRNITLETKNFARHTPVISASDGH